jgi:hypothetical protein
MDNDTDSLPLIFVSASLSLILPRNHHLTPLHLPKHLELPFFNMKILYLGVCIPHFCGDSLTDPTCVGSQERRIASEGAVC